MITDEEMEAAVYARFPGSDTTSSACRGAWRYGAKWAIEKTNEYVKQSDAFRRASDKQFLNTVEENAALREENAELRKLLNDIIAVSDKEKSARWAGYRNYEDAVYAAIKKAKDALK